MFLHMSYCESEQSATPQPHMTQLTGGGWEESQGHAGGIDERTDRLRCRSRNFTSPAVGSSFRSTLAKVCFNSEQTGGFDKHHSNRRPPT